MLNHELEYKQGKYVHSMHMDSVIVPRVPYALEHSMAFETQQMVSPPKEGVE